jgi:transcriptional regulator with XRE-family HTH domain
MAIVSEAAVLIRKARNEAGLSQAELGRRLGMSQAAVAKLERTGSNPTVDTLGDVLWATGRELELAAPAKRPGVDESLIRQQLELTPAQRMLDIEAMYAQARALALAGARSRGERD